MKKYLINIGLVIGIGLVTLRLLVGDSDIISILDDFTRLSIRWTAIGFVCIALYWGFETIIQHTLVEKMHKGNGLWNAFKVVMSGHFFNAITPFASGGQPMQAFIMMKQGVPLGTSASVLLSKFIIYQITLTIYSLVVLILQLNFFVVKVKGIIYLSLIGFCVNLAVVIVLIMAAFMKERTMRMGIWFVNLLHKMHMIKDAYPLKKKLVNQVQLFNENIGEMKKNKRLLLRVCILTIGQLTAYFLIPYAVYRAFGLKGAEVFVIISAAAFIVMFSAFVPIPGGSGVAEGSFFLLFQLFFPQAILPTAVLCWRIITFYVPLCLGGIITALPNQKNRKIKMKVPTGI
ncbi:MAG: flippase-like domain-containing protein [Cellulosilyticum sp.]|nr:flippase-like domain-containing protein [Cellulosilyticum sp.]